MSTNTYLFYDFETSKLPLFDQPSDHPDQCHIVQIGAHNAMADVQAVKRIFFKLPTESRT